MIHIHKLCDKANWIDSWWEVMGLSQQPGLPLWLIWWRIHLQWGDPGSIPGWGRSPGEGTGYPFQHSWASFVAQLVKNQPAIRETWVKSLGWEDPPEEATTTLSSVLAWKIAWTIHGVTKSRTWMSNFHSLEISWCKFTLKIYSYISVLSKTKVLPLSLF